MLPIKNGRLERLVPSLANGIMQGQVFVHCPQEEAVESWGLCPPDVIVHAPLGVLNRGEQDCLVF